MNITTLEPAPQCLGNGCAAALLTRLRAQGVTFTRACSNPHAGNWLGDSVFFWWTTEQGRAAVDANRRELATHIDRIGILLWAEAMIAAESTDFSTRAIASRLSY